MKYPSKVWDSRDELFWGSDGIADGEKRIEGFGVDEEVVSGVEVPTCDTSHITIISDPSGEGDEGPPISPDDPWSDFAEAVYLYGLDVDLDGSTSNKPRLAQESEGEVWTLPGSDFTDGEAVVEVEWPLTLPFDVDQVELRFDDNTVIAVRAEALSSTGTVLTDTPSLPPLGDYAMLPFDDTTQPTAVRFTIERTDTSDLDILDVMVRPHSVEP